MQIIQTGIVPSSSTWLHPSVITSQAPTMQEQSLHVWVDFLGDLDKGRFRACFRQKLFISILETGSFVFFSSPFTRS